MNAKDILKSFHDLVIIKIYLASLSKCKTGLIIILIKRLFTELFTRLP